MPLNNRLETLITTYQSKRLRDPSINLSYIKYSLTYPYINLFHTKNTLIKITHPMSITSFPLKKYLNIL